VSQGVLGADLAPQGGTPLAAVAERLLGPFGASLLVACTAVAVFGALSADLLNTPRAFFAEARAGILPSAMARVHPRFATPHVAIAVYAGLVFTVSISGAFRTLAVLATLSQLLVYLFVCLAVLRMRSKRVRVPGTFRAPGGPVVPVIGTALVLWLMSHSTLVEVGAVTLLVALAAVYYVVRTTGTRPRLSDLSRR
jgi:basic amino acid/polyamine antiporter, APA family